MNYQAQSVRVAMSSASASKAVGERVAVPRVVYWIGLTSLLTDVSAEMIASTLPVFLFSVLALSPLQVGFIDGLYHGATGLVRVFAGYWADTKFGNRFVALFGYGLSAFARIVMLLAASFGALFAFAGLFADRLGKGIRTAPRDALIAGHTPNDIHGAAFGVHRTMDAVGAFAGPLIAAAILWWKPQGYEWLIAVSLGFAFAGVLSFWLYVPDDKKPSAISFSHRDVASETQETQTSVAGHAHKVLPRTQTVGSTLKRLFAHRSYMMLLALAAIMSIFTISDGLIFASLQRAAGFEEHNVPLMFVGVALVFLLTAAPIGRWADRLGMVRTMLCGYAALALCYVFFAVGSMGGYAVPTLTLTTTIALLGLHYSATDGILAAFAVKTLDPSVRTTGLALLTTVIGVTRIAASTLYGYLWQHGSQSIAAVTFASGITGCVLIAVVALRRGSLNLDGGERSA